MHIYCIAAYIPDFIMEIFIYNLQYSISWMQEAKHVDKVHPDDFFLRMQKYVLIGVYWICALVCYLLLAVSTC